MARVDIPFNLSYDGRNSLAYDAIARDQRRVNMFYENERGVEAGQQVPRVALVRRPGVTDVGNTYGAASQVQYLVCQDPGSGWTTPSSWVFTKLSNDIKVHNSSTSTTILTSADYVPRFVGIVNISGVDTVVLQCQNITSPEGAPSQRVFTSSAIATWAEITDADFTALKLRGQMVFMDGYGFIATGNARLHQCLVNNLASWQPADYLTKGITQDATQGLMVCRNQVLMSGREATEVFTNQGNSFGSVLSRLPYSTHRVGLAGTAGADGTLTGKTHYYAQLGSALFFAGRLGGHASSVNLIAWDGNRFEKVSRTYEDKILSSTETYGVYKVAFFGKVGIGVVLTAPTVATQRGLVFFPEVNDWFEWESPKFSLVNNGGHFCASPTYPTKLYHFPLSNNYQDDSVAFDAYVQFKIPRGGDNMMAMYDFGILADNVSSNSMTYEASDDDGVTWSTARSISLANTLKRLPGGLGMFRQRMVRLKHNDSGEVRLHGAYCNLVELPF